MTEFDRIAQTDPVVASILRGGGSLEDCIVALVGFKGELILEVMGLRAQAPKRLILPGGVVRVVQTADNFSHDPTG